MRLWFVMLNLVVLGLFSAAASVNVNANASTSTNTSTNTNTSLSPLESSLKTEISLVEAQIQQFQKSKREMETRQQEKLKKLQSSFLEEQSKLTKLQSENQKKADELQRLQNDISSFHKMKERVDSTWERTFKVWKDKQAFYFLNTGAADQETWLSLTSTQGGINISQKRDILQGIFDYLSATQASVELPLNYLDDGDLVTGRVVRIGGLGAQINDSKLPVVPLESGVLSKVLKETQAGAKGVFIFKDLNKSQMSMSAGLWDRVVFSMPALFMILLFAIVFVLFGLFVKE